MADLSISLGGREFKVSRLTIRQSRDLRIGDAQSIPDDGAAGWTTLYDSCLRKIAVAIRENHPEMTEEELWKLPASEEEMLEACRQILIFAGFKAPEATIAELRATVVTKKNELTELEATLQERETKAKQTGEG